MTHLEAAAARAARPELSLRSSLRVASFRERGTRTRQQAHERELR